MIKKIDIQENPSAYPVVCYSVKTKLSYKGRILGVKNDFPVVCAENFTCEFSWASLLRHLNTNPNEKNYLLV